MKKRTSHIVNIIMGCLLVIVLLSLGYVIFLRHNAVYITDNTAKQLSVENDQTETSTVKEEKIVYESEKLTPVAEIEDTSELPNVVIQDYTGTVFINEIMPKNKASVQNEEGEYLGWVELFNNSEDDIELTGWSFQRKNLNFSLDGQVLKSKEYLLVFINEDGENSFTLKDGSKLELLDSEGRVISKVKMPDLQKDSSYARQENGEYKSTLYPTPYYPNTIEAFEQWQENSKTTSPITISEVVTFNDSLLYDDVYGYCDWVELKNQSEEAVLLSDYALSDKLSDLSQCPLPEITIAPDEMVIILCSDGKTVGRGKTNNNVIMLPLNSENETLYLTYSGKIVESLSLKAIPYGGSYGRMDDRGGCFYFTNPSPMETNENGCRVIAEQPSFSIPGGQYDIEESMTVELDADGEIYYTLDSSAPNENSIHYTEPIIISENTVIRAISVVEGQIVSSVATENYIINMGHSLPIVCVNTDNPSKMTSVYRISSKDARVLGNISMYENGTGFSANCSVSMNGGTSLELPKKSMLIRFKGAYGTSEIDYDIFGDGNTGLSQLVLRVGQDYYNAVVRNEVCQTAAREFTECVLTQRGRWCVLYLNGKYYGIYALKEDDDAHLYSDQYNVDSKSVSTDVGMVSEWSTFYDFVSFVMNNNMANENNYDYLCENYLDIDSFIDWLVVEGHSGNPDLLLGNMKYAKSSEDDGKIRMIYYDLDASLSRTWFVYRNVITPNTDNQVSIMTRKLLQNAKFKDKFLKRVNEALHGALSDEHMIELIDEMVEEIDSEMHRDIAFWKAYDYETWCEAVDRLRTTMDGYHSIVIENLQSILRLTDSEVEAYFGDLCQ